MVTWGHSDKTFAIVVGDLVHQRKVYFKTAQGKDINEMVRVYVGALVAAMEAKDAEAAANSGAVGEKKE